MYTQQILWTCSGGMKIVYPREFAKMIPHQVMQSPHIEVAMQKKAFWDFEAGAEFVHGLPPIDASFERVSHELQVFHQITEYDKMKAQHQRNGFMQFREQIQDAAFKRIEEEFRIMVAKREPTFFMKDLSMENVEKLSEEYAKQMGSDACGVNIQLSPYQKFFVIIDPSDLMFYSAEVTRHRVDLPGPVQEYLGKLVDLRPDKWQMGRYEDLTYMKELSAMQRFVPITGEGGNESR